MKRILSRKYWLMSWNRWVKNVGYAINKTDAKSSIECGYCADAESFSKTRYPWYCTDCLINKRACSAGGEDGYFDWWYYASIPRRLKYARYLLKAIYKDGVKWVYMTEKREETYNKLMGAGK